MSTRTDRASRRIKADRPAIYHAMTEAGAVKQWLPPHGMTAEIVHFDARPGGRYRMVLRYDDQSISGKSGDNSDVVEARFVELVPDQLVVQEVDFVSQDPRFCGTMTMRWELSAVADATLVEIIASNVPDGISASDHADGMSASLANLAAFVER
jgi:uncharacterized protein YndB with AHSA1/START domain